MIPSHTFWQKVSIADPCVGGGPYGHHPVAIAFPGASLHICFVDEAGDLGALGNPPQPNDQPVLAIGGLFVDAANLANLTDNFLTLKYQYFPGLPYPSTRHLDRILPEVKGADIRTNATRGNARQRTHAIGFLDRILGLLRHNDVRMVARIWVKGIGSRFDATSVPWDGRRRPFRSNSLGHRHRGNDQFNGSLLCPVQDALTGGCPALFLIGRAECPGVEWGSPKPWHSRARARKLSTGCQAAR